MKTFLSPSDLAPSADLAADATAVRADLAALPLLDAACDKNDADKAAAAVALTAGRDALSAAHIARAKGNGPTDAQTKKRAAEVVEFLAGADALDTASVALLGELQTVEVRVKEWATSTGRMNLADRYAAEITATFAARCRVAHDAPPWAYVVEATALSVVTGARPLFDWLQSVRFDLPSSGEFINGERLTLPNGTRVLAREAAAPRIEELRAAGASDFRKLHADCCNYTRRAERLAAKVPYVRKGRAYPPSGTEPKTFAPQVATPAHDANRAAALQARSGPPPSEFAPRAPAGVFGV